MKRRSGITLLEMTIASTLLIAVFGVGISVLLRSGTIAAKASQAGHHEAVGRQVTNHCRTHFLYARVSGPGPALGGASTLGIWSNYTEVRYQVPVTPDERGKLRFGATNRIGEDDPAGQDRVCILRFEAEIVLRESAAATAAASQPAAAWGPGFPPLPTLSTVTLDLDLDGNGSRADTFLSGRLQKYEVNARGDFLGVESLCRGVILRVEPAASPYAYDMNRPGFDGPEPLFRFVDGRGALVPGSSPGATAAAIVVTLWNGSAEENGKRFLLRKSSEVVRFRNPQS
jgi:hypothetical protein